jgi:hypothetical protein
MKRTLFVAAAVALGTAFSTSATIINIVVDEYGHGYVGLPDGKTILGGLGYSTTVADPFATAHTETVNLTLSYALDPSWTITSGDIRADDSIQGPVRSDIWRFINSRLYVYSDKDDTDNPPALADVGVPITMQSTTKYFASETDPLNAHPSGLSITPGANGKVWNATTSADPGYISGSINGSDITGVNYYFISDGSVVPEPTTVLAGALLLLPFGASTLRILRKKLTA